MQYFTIQEMRLQMGLVDTDTSRDAEITSCTEDATAYIECEICRPFAEVLEDGALPLPLKRAVKMLATSYFNVREGITDKAYKELPFGITALCAKYRKYS